ncbi:MAG: RHS repeat-associated core domain-containing protein, partial [Acidobacteria bacterium]|nr:RHS repeat-associated core domain-containing protein [Acidobacteriota bacterium]
SLIVRRALVPSRATGRFIEQDPIGEAGGLNLYAYAAASPTLWVDPTGLRPQGSNFETPSMTFDRMRAEAQSRINIRGSSYDPRRDAEDAHTRRLEAIEHELYSDLIMRARFGDKEALAQLGVEGQEEEDPAAALDEKDKGTEGTPGADAESQRTGATFSFDEAWKACEGSGFCGPKSDYPNISGMISPGGKAGHVSVPETWKVAAERFSDSPMSGGEGTLGVPASTREDNAGSLVLLVAIAAQASNLMNNGVDRERAIDFATGVVLRGLDRIEAQGVIVGADTAFQAIAAMGDEHQRQRVAGFLDGHVLRVETAVGQGRARVYDGGFRIGDHDFNFTKPEYFYYEKKY